MPNRRHALTLLAMPAWAALAQAPRRLDAQGHRGARGLLPENTLPAFERALSIGVSTLELDVGITRDGVAVVSHDARLNPDITRGPDGRYLDGMGPAISHLSVEELSAYDVGRIRPESAYARQFPEQQAIDRTRIPRLSEVIELVKQPRQAHVRLAVETKLSPLRPQDTLPVAEFTRIVIRTLRDAGVAARSTIQSFDWRSLQQVAREAPEMGTSHLTMRRPSLDNVAPGSPWTGGFDLRDHASVAHMIKAAGGRCWSSFHQDLSPDAIEQAHGLGLTVLAWTVNEPARMRELMGWKVDGIITDRPDRLRAVMDELGVTLA